jgi:hypothetical protein
MIILSKITHFIRIIALIRAMKDNQGSWKNFLKTNIEKTKIFIIIFLNNKIISKINNNFRIMIIKIIKTHYK